MIGLRAQLRLPRRFHAGFGVAALPASFVDVSSGIASAVSGLDATESDLVGSGLDDGFSLKLFAGWRPFPEEVFFIQAGYAYFQLDGALEANDVLTLGLIDDLSTAQGWVELNTALHAGELELGFRWSVEDVRFRVSMGLAVVLGSASDVQVDIEGLPAAEARVAETQAAQAVDDGFTGSGVFPSLGFGVAYDLRL